MLFGLEKICLKMFEKLENMLHQEANYLQYWKHHGLTLRKMQMVL